MQDVLSTVKKSSLTLALVVAFTCGDAARAGLPDNGLPDNGLPNDGRTATPRHRCRIRAPRAGSSTRPSVTSGQILTRATA